MRFRVGLPALALMIAAACTEIPNTQVAGEILGADPANRELTLVDEMGNRWRVDLVPTCRIATEYDVELGLADLPVGCTARIWGHRVARDTLAVYLATLLIAPPIVLAEPSSDTMLSDWVIELRGEARVPDHTVGYRLVAGRLRPLSEDSLPWGYRPRAEDALVDAGRAVELTQGQIEVDGAVGGAHGVFTTQIAVDSTDDRLADADAVVIELSARTVRGVLDTFSVIRSLRLRRRVIASGPVEADSLLHPEPTPSIMAVEADAR
jgi:hypothetical protein